MSLGIYLLIDFAPKIWQNSLPARSKGTEGLWDLRDRGSFVEFWGEVPKVYSRIDPDSWSSQSAISTWSFSASWWRQSREPSSSKARVVTWVQHMICGMLIMYHDKIDMMWNVDRMIWCMIIYHDKKSKDCKQGLWHLNTHVDDSIWHIMITVYDKLIWYMIYYDYSLW